MIYPLVKNYDKRVDALAEKFWPGPLTIILEKSDMVPNVVSANLNTVAIRFPSNEVARALISEANVPVTAPSANLSGSPSPTSAKYVIEDLSGRVDCILNSHNCSLGVESTVISLVGKRPRLLRPGFITIEELVEVLGEIDVDKAVYESISNDTVVNAPGMKYKHYAPKARVIVVKGSFGKYKSFVEQNKTEKTVAMCFTGEGKSLEIPFIEYGFENDSSDQASKLFDALRKVDEMGANSVFVRSPGCKGVGLAVTNRLLKAAGFEVIEL